MNKSTRDQLQTAAFEIAVSAAVEFALIAAARRMRYAPAVRRRRRLRRLAAAVLAESVRASASAMHRENLRIKVAIDQAVAAQEVAATQARPRVRIPAPRKTLEKAVARLQPQRREIEAAPAR